jgi:RimJ/RimL family protein N-acetyltransferase
MNAVHERYPRTLRFGDGEVAVRLMTAADEGAVLDFARSLDVHDLLFLRRDITHPKVLGAWVREIEEGTITSLLATEGDKLVGCTAVVRDPMSWSAHVGDLRVLLSPELRARGLGRVLIQEAFIAAIGLGLEKLTAQMTADQTAAIAVFEDMGFRPEALLRDHVAGADGTTHDLVVLGLNVAEFQARHEQYGLVEAWES